MTAGATWEFCEGLARRQAAAVPQRRPSKAAAVSPLFRELDGFAVSGMAERGKILFRCGDPAAGIYLVRSGKITLLWTTDRSVRRVVTVGPGEIVGLPAVLNGVHGLMGRAAFDVAFGFIPAEKLVRLLERDPELCHSATEVMAREVIQVEEFIVAYAHRLGLGPRG